MSHVSKMSDHLAHAYYYRNKIIWYSWAVNFLFLATVKLEPDAHTSQPSIIRPFQVISLFLVNSTWENLPGNQVKKNGAVEKNEL